MKTKILPVLLLLSCGPVRPLELQCTIEQPTFMMLYADFPIDCVDFTYNVELAKRMILSKGLMDEMTFFGMYSGMPVYVYDDDFLRYDLDKKQYISGLYTAFKGIELNRDGTGLLHEMLHHWNFVNFCPGTLWHQGWKEAGWYDMDLQFSQTAIVYGDTPWRKRKEE